MNDNLVFKAAQPCLSKQTQIVAQQQKVNVLCQGLVRRNKKEKKYFTDLVEEVQGSDGPLLTETLLLQMDSKDMLSLVTSDKASAVALQVLLETCSMACKAAVQSVVSENVEKLLVHRTGSYLVQKLLTSGTEEFQPQVVKNCQDNFNKLASNEFASRVMQKLLEINEGFKKFVLKRLSQDLTPFVRDFSAVFLVSGAVQAAETDEERVFVRNTLAQNPKKWLQNKYFKRILVCYLQTCSTSELTTTYMIFRKGSSIFTALEEKYCSLVLLTFIERGLIVAQTETLTLLSFHCTEMIGLKFFGYFVSQLLRKPIHCEFVRKVDLTLRTAGKATFEILMSDPALYKIYSSIILELKNFFSPNAANTRPKSEATSVIGEN
jgi:hypothetical protein